MLIADHLDWVDAISHLEILQDKINSYLAFIENKQYEEIHSDYDVQSYSIQIKFMHDVPQLGLDYLNYAANQVKEISVMIEAEVTG